jgi:hypothetical protein
MISPNVANTVWAMAEFELPPAGSPRDALWAAVSAWLPMMNSQVVANKLIAAEDFGCMQFVFLAWECACVQDMRCTSLGTGLS